jgi:hypothetical protein
VNTIWLNFGRPCGGRAIGLDLASCVANCHSQRRTSQFSKIGWQAVA